MQKINVLPSSLTLSLSNTYSKVMIQCLEPMILKMRNLIVYSIKWKKSCIIWTLSSNILGSRHFMMTSKYFFDRSKARLKGTTFIFCITYLFLFYKGANSAISCVLHTDPKFKQRDFKVGI